MAGWETFGAYQAVEIGPINEAECVDEREENEVNWAVADFDEVLDLSKSRSSSTF
jgi:hypothetical protein